MVFAEATTVLPLIASYAYNSRAWEERKAKQWSLIYDEVKV
jgi:deoxyhypusine synthase